MINFAWAKTPADHMDQYADIVGSSQGKGVPAGMMVQMQRHASYIKTKLTPEEHGKLHKNISAHVNRLMKEDEISAEEASFIKKTYSPPVKESTDMDIQERKMTKPEMDKREKMVKSMKKSYGDFKKRYGDRAKEVMYATATKQAMKTEEIEPTTGSPNMIHHALVQGRPTPPKKVGRRDIHLQHTHGTNPNGDDARFKVVGAGDQNPLKVRVGDTLSGKRVGNYMDRGIEGGTVHVHTAHPNPHFIEEQTEGQHYCAKHVYSEVYGEGVVVEGQHAEPDETGNLEWYTVQFDHGEEVIFTEDVEVMMAEYHNNHSPMKKKAKKAKE
jgi:hypothetical protein